MSKQTMVTIDPVKLRAFVAEKGVFEVTKMIGKAPNYFNNVCKRRSMPYGVLQALCAIYTKKPEDFKPAELNPLPFPVPFVPECPSLFETVEKRKETPMPSTGYALDLRVNPAFVSLALYEDSKMLKIAKAKIKNGEKASQLDVVQAISYAAHMLYKFMEQDAIE